MLVRRFVDNSQRNTCSFLEHNYVMGFRGYQTRSTEYRWGILRFGLVSYQLMTWREEGKVWVGDIQIRRQYLRLVSQFIAQLRPQFTPSHHFSLLTFFYMSSALQSLQVLPLSFPVAMGNDVVQASSTCLFDEKSAKAVMSIFFPSLCRISFNPPLSVFLCRSPFSCWIERAASP